MKAGWEIAGKVGMRLVLMFVMIPGAFAEDDDEQAMADFVGGDGGAAMVESNAGGVFGGETERASGVFGAEKSYGCGSVAN